MARATWSGFLSFGLVSVPVGLYSATADQTIHFNQLHKGTSNRIRYKKVDEETGEEISSDDIVNGFPLGGGEYVVVTREEMAEAAPGKSELIEIQDFVDLDEIDPIFFRQSYYLAPKGKGADRAYALLLEAMRETKKVGIATLVLRDKEHLVAVRPAEKVLMLETMYFEDEIRDPEQELDTLPPVGHANPRELSIAKKLVDSLTDEWDPSRYKNTYRERVEELIEEKRAGHAVVHGAEERPKSNVIDLMSALQASIDRSSSKRPARSAAKATAATKGSSMKVSAHRERQGLDSMTKADLLERAARLKLDVNAKMTKADLVRAVSDAKPAAKKSGRRVS
ncbi:MAG TPA: Ku protein [Acidimicrobiales bacterium]|jgi:DNA end-binding protein Ku